MGSPTVTPLSEARHDGGFIVSVANGHQSFEQVVLAASTAVVAGDVLGIVTADGTYAQYNPAHSDGTQTVAGIAHAAKASLAAAQPLTIVKRNAEVNLSELNWFSGASGGQITTGVAALASVLGILAR